MHYGFWQKWHRVKIQRCAVYTFLSVLITMRIPQSPQACTHMNDTIHFDPVFTRRAHRDALVLQKWSDVGCEHNVCERLICTPRGIVTFDLRWVLRGQCSVQYTVAPFGLFGSSFTKNTDAGWDLTDLESTLRWCPSNFEVWNSKRTTAFKSKHNYRRKCTKVTYFDLREDSVR